MTNNRNSELLNNNNYHRLSYSNVKSKGRPSPIEEDQPVSGYPLRQRSQDVMDGMKEFINAGSGIVDKLGASMVNKANSLLTKYKIQKSALEESIQMLVSFFDVWKDEC